MWIDFQKQHPLIAVRISLLQGRDCLITLAEADLNKPEGKEICNADASGAAILQVSAQPPVFFPIRLIPGPNLPTGPHVDCSDSPLSATPLWLQSTFSLADKPIPNLNECQHSSDPTLRFPKTPELPHRIAGRCRQ